MTKTKINLKPLIVIIISIATLAVTSLCLRQWNRNHRASLGLRDGIEAFESKQWQIAAENLGKYIAIVPDDVSVIMKYADAQIKIVPMNINTINQAVNSYRRALRLDPTHSKAVLSLMEIYIQLLNSPAEAELIAVEYLTRASDIAVRRTLAISFYKQRKFKDAQQEIMRIITDEPTEVTAYAIAARFAEERPQDFTDDPQKLYDQAVTASPKSPLAYIVRGEYYLRQSKKSDAIKDFNKAETLSLSDVDTRVRLAKAFFDARVLDKTAKHLEHASASNPDNISIWQLWAKLALTNQSAEEMSTVARKGCKYLTNDLPLFLPAAAELLIRSSDYGKAAQAIDQLKQADNSAAKVAFLNGLMARRQGNTAKAIMQWQKAGELGLGIDQVTLPMASALADSGDVPSAIIQLRNYITRENYSPRANLMLAEYLAQTGKYSQAFEQINKYLQFDPQSIKARLMASNLQNRIDSKSNINVSNSTNNEKGSQIAWDKLQEEIQIAVGKNNLPLSDMTAAISIAIENQKLTFARQIIDTVKKQYPDEQLVMLSDVQLLIAENKRQDAMTKLKKIVEIFPTSIKALRYITRLSAEENDWATPQQVLLKARQSVASPDDARKKEMLLAEVYVRSSQFDKAWETLNAIHQVNPADIPVIRWLISIAGPSGMSHQRQPLVDMIKTAEGTQGWQWRYEQARLWFESDDFQKYYDQIVTHLKENLKINSSDQPSRLLLAAAYEKAGNFQLASSAYKQALNHSPNDIDITLSAVSVMHKAGEYDLADQIISKARSGSMTDHRLSALELNSHIKKRNYSSAITIAQKLSQENPQDTRLKLSLALLNIRDKKFTAAASVLDNLYQQNPNSIEITAALVELNIQLNNHATAIEICSKLIETTPTSKAYTLRGRTYMRIANNTNAEQNLQKALQMDPESIPAMTLLARLYQSSARPQKAVQLITKAIETAPDNFDAQKNAALIFLTSNDPATAANTKQAMEKALQINPDDVEMLMLKARMLFTQRSAAAYRKALKILQRITSIDPMYSQAWAITAEINLLQGDYSKAMDSVVTGLAYQPSSKLLHLSKARIEASQFPNRAVQTLTALHQNYPEDIDIAVYLAYTYITADQSSSAVKLLKSLETKVAVDPNRQKVEIALAEALYANGNSTESMQKVASLYRAYPNSKAPLMLHARILRSNAQWNKLANLVTRWYSEHENDSVTAMTIIQQFLNYKKPPTVDCAEVILREIVDMDYDNVDALNALGVLLHITGRSKQALKCYEKVLMLDPERIVAINNMAWILCEEQNKYDQALQLTASGLSRYPDYADLIDTAGVASYRLEKYDESINYFKKCMKLRNTTESESASVHFHIARSLEKTGNFKEAIDHLKKAIEINKLNGGLSTAEFAEVNMLLSEISERN